MASVFGELREEERARRRSADSPQPTMKVMPYIVEYHFGSSDIIQSIEAKREREDDHQQARRAPTCGA